MSSFMSSLHILKTSPLYDEEMVKIFSVNCHFDLLTVSLALQKLFSFMRSHFSIVETFYLSKNSPFWKKISSWHQKHLCNRKLCGDQNTDNKKKNTVKYLYNSQKWSVSPLNGCSAPTLTYTRQLATHGECEWCQGVRVRCCGGACVVVCSPQNILIRVDKGQSKPGEWTSSWCWLKLLKF